MGSVHKYDFGGTATRFNVQCSDGKTIAESFGDSNDGKIVPLCWQHNHDDPENVLGQVKIVKRKDGTGLYCKASFNNSEKAQAAKEAVQHGDIDALSIYANNLTKNGNVVTDGSIKEVSLVYAGANPGAFIDYVEVRHSEDGGLEMYHSEEETEQAIIHGNDIIDQIDFEEEEEMAQSSVKETNDKNVIMSEDQFKEVIEHAVKSAMDAKTAEDNETIQDVLDTLSPKQKKAVDAAIGLALKHDDMGEDEDEPEDTEVDETEDEEVNGGDPVPEDMEEDDDEENVEHMEDSMKENLFEGKQNTNEVLIHSDLKNELFGNFSEMGSFKKALHNQDFLAHAAATGISNIGNLFPEPKLVDGTPFPLEIDAEWVTDMMADISKTPFGRLKSTIFDMSKEEARARGYIKGNTKVDSQFAAIKRVTNPTVVYAKAELDKQDILEITDYNVVAILKHGLDVVLRNEVCQQILISDLRTASSNDKIANDSIRPIAFDDEMYTIRKVVTLADTATSKTTVDTIRKAVYDARKDYKGSGSMKMYATPTLISNMMLAQDGMGRDLFETEQSLANAMRAKKLVEVPQMDGATFTVTEGSTDVTYDVLAIFVNLRDYKIGAVKGGETTSYEDFDIDVNQMKYLTETFMSGALVRPKSAICIVRVHSDSVEG